MNYAYDDASWSVENEFLFGDDFLVAPCMDEGSVQVSVYFPALSGHWIHLVSVNYFTWRIMLPSCYY